MEVSIRRNIALCNDRILALSDAVAEVTLYSKSLVQQCWENHLPRYRVSTDRESLTEYNRLPVRSVIKMMFLFMGFGMSTDALSEPALTLSGEVNYGEFCQVNVVSYCAVNKCKARKKLPATTIKTSQAAVPIT